MSSGKADGYKRFFLLIGFLLIGYFFFYAFWGPRGYINFKVLRKELDLIKQEQQLVSEERARLEKRVLGLSDKSIDLDLLEEQVRNMLNYSHPNDLVIIEDGDN